MRVRGWGGALSRTAGECKNDLASIENYEKTGNVSQQHGEPSFHIVSKQPTPYTALYGLAWGELGGEYSRECLRVGRP